MTDVMVLRRKLIWSEISRYHTISTSVFKDGWLEELSRF